jgi:hypothetical protein
VVVTILHNFSFCVHCLAGPVTKHQLKISLFVDLELGPVAVLVAVAD